MKGKRESGTAKGLHSLQLSDVSVSFGGVKALTSVKFDFGDGILGIVGANGAGKTTLSNVIAGFTRPSTGSVMFDGHDLVKSGPSARAHLGIGRSFQHPPLVPSLTIWENLSAGLVSGRGSRHHMEETVNALGLEEWLGREVDSVPYGVQKVVDLGRALVGRPILLVCDEPLSGVDAGVRERILGLLTAINDRGTMLAIIEHDLPRLTRVATQMVVMDFGRVVVQGPTAQVLEDPRLAEAFVGTGDA